jgi:hypothetical protein
VKLPRFMVNFHPILTTNKSKVSLIIMNLSNLRSSKSSILDKTLTKGKNEVSLSLYALVFSEIVQYSQKNSQSVADLAEKVKEFEFWVDLGGSFTR